DAAVRPRVSEHGIAANVARKRRVMTRVGEAPRFLQLDKLLRLISRQVAYRAQLPRENQDAAVRVENLAPPISPLERFAKADRAMVGQNDHVRLAYKRQDRFGEFFAARRFVWRDRHFPEKDFYFRQYALRDWLSRNGERRRMRRMAM